MALYNYSRHYVDQAYIESPTWTYDRMDVQSLYGWYKGYTFDASTGEYKPSGGAWAYGDVVPPGVVGYSFFYGDVERMTSTHIHTGGHTEDNFTVRRDRKAKSILRGDVRGSYMGNVVAEYGTYPANGKHTDGYWYVLGSIYVPPNNAPTVPGAITTSGELKVNSAVTFSYGASSDPEGNHPQYQSNIQLYRNGVAQGWINDISTGGRSVQFTIPNDTTINAIEFRVRARDDQMAYSAYRTAKFDVTNNKIPTITLNTTDNRTMYENDVMLVEGTATDADLNNNILVKYQINSGTVYNLLSQLSAGVAIPFNKSLTFKQNKFYDGATAVTPDLAEGSQHTLKVWAEDDKSGKSAEAVRTFYVVPNRPATLTLDPFTLRNDLINTDVITISGNVSDPDNNGVTVKYKIANGSFTEVYSGQGGAFSFQVLLDNLAVGANVLTVQAVDSFGAISSKTLSVKKTEKLQPLLQGDTRYKVIPPNGTATGVTLWIEREVGDLIVNAEISMTAAGEPENFVPMILDSTAFVTTGVEEDEFRFDAGTAKESIVLRITQTRTNSSSTAGIKLISGVLS